MNQRQDVKAAILDQASRICPVWNREHQQGGAIIPFQKTQWLFPIAVTLHSAEEAFSMPKWVAVHSSQLPLRPGAARIWSGLLVLTLAAFAVTYLSARKGKGSLWTYLLFGYAVAMLVNPTSYPGNLGLRRIHSRYSHRDLDQPPDHEHSRIPSSTRAVGVGDEGNRVRSAGSARDRRRDFGPVRTSLIWGEVSIPLFILDWCCPESIGEVAAYKH